MTKPAQQYVAYYRVSTVRQGLSGLGLDAQKAAVAAHVQHTGATLLSEYVEVESGRKVHRQQLSAALADARAQRATLVIAKLDRLSRDVAFLSALMNGDVPFVALDLPGANRLTLHVMAAVAENEAVAVSQRTKAALAAARARGVKLGCPANLTAMAWRRSLEVRQARAAERYRTVVPLVTAWRAAGWTLRAMADELTSLRVPLPRAGRQWEPTQVKRLLAKVRGHDVTRRHRADAAGDGTRA